jgi:hypothetical protein
MFINQSVSIKPEFKLNETRIQKMIIKSNLILKLQFNNFPYHIASILSFFSYSYIQVDINFYKSI